MIRTNDRTVFVLLALGANLGDPARQLAAGLDALETIMKIDAVSDIYQTEPVGIREQPDFLNLVLSARTSLPIYDLHEATRRIEREIGREAAEPNGPRRIDIDLLAYGDLVLDAPLLQVPHPRMEERSFVLVPLDEIVPRWRHPVTGATPSQCLGSLERKSWTFRLGPIERR